MFCKKIHEIAEDHFKALEGSLVAPYFEELEKVPYFWGLINEIRKSINLNVLNESLAVIGKKSKKKGVKRTGEWRVFMAIEELGEKNAKKIYYHFKGLKYSLRASKDELKKLKFVDNNLANKIYEKIIMKWKY